MTIDNSEDWDLIIQPRKGLFQIDLKEIWRYRDLISLFIRRDFVSKYKQTILGPIWFIMQPVLTTVMFTLIFTHVAKISTDGLPPVLFYMSGIVAWTYFSTCFNNTSSTFLTNEKIFSKVYFPRLTVPIAVILSNLIQFFIQFGLLLLLMGYFYFKGAPIHFNAAMLLLPVLILLMAMLGLGFGIVVSSLTTKYRDLTYLVTFGVQLWMYATPVVYPLSEVSEKYRSLVLLNPLSSIIETFRFALLGSGSINFFNLLYSALFSIFIIAAGMLIFNRIEKSFIDTV